MDTTAVRDCPLGPAMGVIGGRWKSEIAWTLCSGEPRRFNELRRLLGTVTPKMLAQQLREMERDGIVSRTQYNEIPPRVEYQITGLGETLGPIFSILAQWGTEHSRALDAARASYDQRLSSQ